MIIKGLDKTMYADFYMNWSFFLRQKGFNNAEAFSSSTPRFRDIGRCYSTSSSAFDCSTRRNEVRYDTPDMYGFVGSWAWGEDDVWSAALRFQKEWDNWKIGAGYAYEDFTDELVNAGGGGVPNQGFKRHLQGMGGHGLDHPQADRSVPVGRQQQLRERRYRRGGCLHRQGPARHACLGHRRRYPSRASSHPARPPCGAATPRTRTASAASPAPRSPHRSSARRRSYSVWDGEVSAGAFPGIPFKTEITSSETTKWYLAVDQAIDSAALNLFVAYQHIEPEITLVTRDPTVLADRKAQERSRSRSTISTCSTWVAASPSISSSAFSATTKTALRGGLFLCACNRPGRVLNLWLCGHRQWTIYADSPILTAP